MILVRGVIRVEGRAFWEYRVQKFITTTRTGRAAIEGTGDVTGLGMVGGRFCSRDGISFR